MFYDNFIEKCNEKGIKPYKVLRLLAIPSAHITSWKERGSTPNVYYIYEIAKYLGCRIEDLIDREYL